MLKNVKLDSMDKQEKIKPDENKNEENITKEDVSELKDLLLRNLELNEKVYQISRKVDNFILVSRIFTVLKVLVFLVPIIIGFLYLPRLLEPVIKQYQEALDLKGGLEDLDANKILDILN